MEAIIELNKQHLNSLVNCCPGKIEFVLMEMRFGNILVKTAVCVANVGLTCIPWFYRFVF